MKTILIAALIGASFPALATAGTLVTLNPTSGDITGGPGDTVGWGFDIQNTSPGIWVSFTQSFLLNETNPSVGTYTDLIGPQGGPVNFELGPNTPWDETFDAVAQTGMGSFLIDPAAVIGAVDSGSIRILWDEYTGDPQTCSDCRATEFSTDLPFSVTVDPATAPEPSTAWLALAGGFLVGVRRIRRR